MTTLRCTRGSSLPRGANGSRCARAAAHLLASVAIPNVFFTEWSNKGDEDGDLRPPLGSGYERLAPVTPHRPAVPPAPRRAATGRPEGRRDSGLSLLTPKGDDNDQRGNACDAEIGTGRRDRGRLRHGIPPGRSQAVWVTRLLTWELVSRLTTWRHPRRDDATSRPLSTG